LRILEAARGSIPDFDSTFFIVFFDFVPQLSAQLPAISSCEAQNHRVKNHRVKLGGASLRS